jgi:exopolyphosphatase/guanosine-5'-triphosphate,3'-diphosphate pyrophosphatase
MGTSKAVLDMGTNSTRFLLVEVDEEGFAPERVIDRGTTVTRLGEGVDASGRLTPDAVDRVLETVRKYDRRVREASGEWLAAVATSACRRAENGDVLLDKVAAQTGVRPSVITGEREAELIFRGVHASLPAHDSARIIDIGGGSTEWIQYEDGELVHLESCPVGVVTVLERCEVEGRWREDQVKRAFEIVGEALPDNRGSGPLIVVGGTGTTLSAHRQGLRTYDPEVVHGDRIPLEEIRSIRDDFQAMTFEELAELDAIQSGREDVMIPGIVILETFAQHADVPSVVVSDYGILAGLIEEADQFESTP